MACDAGMSAFVMREKRFATSERTQIRARFVRANLRTASAAVLHTLKNGVSVLDDSVAALPFDICDKTDPTAVVFEFRPVKTTSGGIS